MKTKFSDVAHLYLGCRIKIGESDKIENIKMVSAFSICTGTNFHEVPLWYKTSACKPILRPLSSMTEEEKEDLKIVMGPSWSGENLLPIIESSRHLNLFFNKTNPTVVAWLLKKGFDLFGLIESSQAIASTAIEK